MPITLKIRTDFVAHFEQNAGIAVRGKDCCFINYELAALRSVLCISWLSMHDCFQKSSSDVNR